MGASEFYATIRRLFRQQRDEVYSDVFDFKPEGQVGVRLFSSKKVLPLPYQPGLSVRDVCEQAAREVQILPLNLPFFTLVTVNGGHVLNLQKNLTEQDCKEDYEFRLVFTGCTAARFADSGSKDVHTLEYLFYQCQYDFLHNDKNITFPDVKEGNTNFQKLVICEIVYRSRLREIPALAILDNLRLYGIQPLLRRGIFSEYSLKEIKKYLKSQIPKIDDKLNDEKLKREYVHTVEQADDYFVHKFTVYKIETYRGGRSQNVQHELLISSRFGIKMRKHDDLNAEVVVENFSEVVNLKIDQVDDTRLTIVRSSSKPQVLFTLSLKDAQSIVAIIDGYYKLLVNRYKNLINQERQPSFKIHGPISRRRAESKVQEIGTDDGLYLIRQCSELFDEYKLTLYCKKSFYHYKIVKKDGNFMFKDTALQRTFHDLNDFMRYYESNADYLVCCLKQNCPPIASQEVFDALLDNQSDVPTSERPQDLAQFGLESIDSNTIKELTVIGKGEYGKVIQAEWRHSEKENPLDIAIRKVEKVYEKEFFNVEKKLMYLRNPNVIRCHGIVILKNSFGLVMEFAPQSLEDYLKTKSNEGKLTIKHAMQFAAQTAEGMMYLQEKQCVHGRLCAHNVFMAQDESNIKISDVGLLDLKSHGGKFFSGSKTEASHCWHALELLINPIKPTHESDIWALGVTIWEIFTLRKPFHTQQTDRPLLRDQVLRMITIRNVYLEIERDSIPKGVAEIIKKCWDLHPEKRISFRDIVSQLRKLFIQGSKVVCASLLAPDQNFVESWEKTDDNESAVASKQAKIVVDPESNSYSIMAADQSDDMQTACKTCLTGPHDAASSNNYRNMTLSFPLPRKQTLQRTSSDPVSPTNAYEEPFKNNIHHYASLVRKSYPLLQNSAPRQPADSDQQNTHPEQDAAQAQAPPPTESLVGEQSGYIHHSNTTHDQDFSEESQSADLPLSQSTDSSLEDNVMAILQKLNLQEQSIDHSINFQATTSSSSEPQGVSGYKDAESLFQAEQYDGHDQPGTYLAGKTEQNPTDPEHDAQDAMKFLSGMLQQNKLQTVAPSHDSGCSVNTTPSNDSKIDFEGSHSSNTVNTKLLHNEGLESSPTEESNANSPITSGEDTQNSGYVQNGTSKKSMPLATTGYVQHNSNSIIPHHTHCNATKEARLLHNEGLHGFIKHYITGESNPTEESNANPPITDYMQYNTFGDNTPNTDYVRHDAIGKSPISWSDSKYVEQPSVSSAANITSPSMNPFVSMQGNISACKPTGYVDSSVLVMSSSDCKEPLPSKTDSSSARCNDRAHLHNSEQIFGGWYCDESHQSYQNKTCTPKNIAVGAKLSSGLSTFPQNPFTLDLQNSLSEGLNDDTSFDKTSEPDQPCVPPNTIVGNEQSVNPLNFPQNLFDSNLQSNPSARSDNYMLFESTSKQDTQECPQNLVDNEPHDIPSHFPSNAYNDGPWSDPTEGSGCESSFESANEQDQTAGMPQNTDVGELSNTSDVPVSNPFTSSPQYNPSDMIEMADISKSNETPSQNQGVTHSNTMFSESGSSSLEDHASDDEIERKQEQRKISIKELKEEVKPSQIISKQNLTWKNLIGKGNFGVVHSGVLTEMKRNKLCQKTDVAIKELLSKMANDKSQEDFINEAINMSKLADIKNDNIIRFIGVCIPDEQDDTEKVLIVTELAAHGDLRLYLRKNKDTITIPKLVDFCSQICNGMVELESHDILHRDLALRNILVKTHELVKISDFGLSRLSEYYKSEGGKWPLKWYAPESLALHKFTSKSDVWSFGVTMWEIFSFGADPYPEINSSVIYGHIIQGNRLPKPDDCPDDVYELMEECWLMDEDELGRPSGNSRPTFYNLFDKLKQLKNKYKE